MTGHPAVEMIATIGVDNPERPGSEIVKAYITRSAETAASDEEALKAEIFAYAKQKLAPYEVPKNIEFREALPLTTVGKIDKKVLRKEARGK